MISAIKAYWRIGLLAVGGALLIAVKVLTTQNGRLRREVENAEVKIHRAKVIAKADQKIEVKFQSRRAEIKDEIKNTGGASAFRNPNELRDENDSS